MFACWLKNCRHIPSAGEVPGWRRSGPLYHGHNHLPSATDPTESVGTNAILEETEKVIKEKSVKVAQKATMGTTERQAVLKKEIKT